METLRLKELVFERMLKNQRAGKDFQNASLDIVGHCTDSTDCNAVGL